MKLRKRITYVIDMTEAEAGKIIAELQEMQRTDQLGTGIMRDLQELLSPSEVSIINVEDV
jgi:K+/H+ antiporter YhaU regulatory subunit KhtT